MRLIDKAGDFLNKADRKTLSRLIRNSVDVKRGRTYIEVGILFMTVLIVLEYVTRPFGMRTFRFAAYRNVVFIILIICAMCFIVEGVGSCYRACRKCESYKFFEAVVDKINYDGARVWLTVSMVNDGKEECFKTSTIYGRGHVLNPDADEYFGKRVLAAHNSQTDVCIIVRVIEEDEENTIIQRYI